MYPSVWDTMTSERVSCTYRFGEFTLSPWERRLVRRGRSVSLEPSPFELLLLLVERPGELVRRKEIEQHFWKAHPTIDVDTAINTFIRKVRRALDDDRAESRFIETVRREGYRFVASVERVTAQTLDETLPNAAVLSPAEPILFQEKAAPPPTASTAPVGAQEGPAPPFEEKHGWTAVAVRICFVLSAALGLGVSLTTSAVGVAATCFAVALAVLLAGYEHLPRSPVSRGLVSLVLLFAMAYVPSAWTLYQLFGVVVNFESLRPAAIYPFITGMKFLPFFALVLAYWTRAAASDAGSHPPRQRMFWGIGTLFTLMTVIGLAAYSGDLEIWSARVPGWQSLAVCYSIVLGINIVLGWAALRELRRDEPGDGRRVLSACTIAYLVLLAPAITIGAQYNAINQSHLADRRTQGYRALNPGAVSGPARAELLRRDDIGPDLRALLQDSQFASALANETFYRVDLDEKFQLSERAVVFGYGRSVGTGTRTFRLLRLPEAVAREFRFEVAAD